ncbi:MAG TPA: bifunctional 5,10-methylenetetrahydrofolate dehydrogenase/5,10-methenyltetrahydrofolate cyclohydrolase [Candidatus Saccharimonadales bacterium]|nr:bifunctional 5,10-methylenetetrahydrofolate dehydrogenase/5,10-methenyltetrahydrofolate cyclohydrolase [Candidatus Saccharimonadales bacterium]
MKLLNGSDLAGFIKERQAHQVRALRQAHQVFPKLAIVMTDLDNQVIDTYVRMKQRYGADILIDVDIHRVEQAKVRDLLKDLASDDTVHAIIVQLPLADMSEAEEILDLVPDHKDVDGLGKNPAYDPATAMAIMWLLTGYNIELKGKDVVLVGYGKLVGAPLEKLMISSGITPRIVDKNTPDVPGEVYKADVIVSATGVAGLIKSDMVKQGAVVVDAGVASEGGKTVGDAAPELYERDDLTITPTKGGVGPLTVCALFDNVIRAATAVAEAKQKSTQKV